MGKLNELINQYTIGKGMLYSVSNSINPTLPVKKWDRNKLSFSVSKSTNRKFVAISDFGIVGLDFNIPLKNKHNSLYDAFVIKTIYEHILCNDIEKCGEGNG